MIRPCIVYSKHNRQACLPVPAYHPDNGTTKMKKSLDVMKSKLEAMIERAQFHCDSENEDVANKYDDVCNNLETALEAINDAKIGRASCRERVCT